MLLLRFIPLLLLLSLPLFPSEIIQKEISFHVTHPMKKVNGTCKEIKIDAVKLKKKGDALELESPFTITIPSQKLNTGDENRDSHILEILNYPEAKEITAEIKSIEKKDNYTINGILTINSVSVPFQSEAIVKSADGKLHVEGSVSVKFSELKLERPSLLFIKVNDLITIKYKFVLEN